MRRALAKRLIPLLIVLVLVIPYFAVSYYDVYGDDKQNLNDANSKKKDLQSQYEQTEKIIEDLKAQNDDMIAYIAQLDAQMSSVDGELNEVNEQVEQIEAEIADTEEKLAQAEIEAEEQYSSMKLRIQFMYEHNDETYFALLMNSHSMGDMLNKAEYITKISQYDREMLEKYNATVTYITVAKAQLETDRETLVTKQEELEDKRASLSLLESTKKSEMASLQKNKQQQEDYKAKIEADIKAQDEYIAKIEAEIKAKENSGSANVVKYDGGKFKWPTESTRITSPYGDTEGRSSPHKGIDIGALNRGVAGDAIYAAYDGDVVIATFSSSAGNYIMINHGGGLYTRYLHASKLLVSAGTHVTKGQKIALMGTTGDSDGVHLHFDVRYNGSYVSPWNYLSK